MFAEPGAVGLRGGTGVGRQALAALDRGRLLHLAAGGRRQVVVDVRVALHVGVAELLLTAVGQRGLAAPAAAQVEAGTHNRRQAVHPDFALQRTIVDEHAEIVGHAGDVVRIARAEGAVERLVRSEEHTSELQSLMRISYAVFCLKQKKTVATKNKTHLRVEYDT